MAAIPFVAADVADYGEVVAVSPLIRRVTANNPNKFTYRGTGTYIVGHREVAVIDPGPDLVEHRDALARALAGDKVTAILITHCHGDHSPLAAWLQEVTGAPTYAFGPHGEVGEADAQDLAELAADDAVDGAAAQELKGESIDVDFVPDVAVADGDVAARGDGWTLTGVHTPGHTSNHMCYALDAERALFTGDHVMGWSTTVVSPPDGDMSAYIASLHKVIAREDRTLWPTHGSPVTEPQPFLAAYLAHRLERERQIMELVDVGVRLIDEMVAVLYAEVDKGLHKAAARSVLSHLTKLVADGAVAVLDGGSAARRAEFVTAKR